MPYPLSTQLDEGSLRFNGGFALQWRSPPDAFLAAGVDRFLADARGLTGLEARAAGGVVALRIECCDRPAVFDDLGQVADESYRLRVDADGVVLTASTSMGVLRGLATLRQLISLDAQG
ncbi:MAG: glycoside hydrolase family 20 zincin-like fold domain-containing protein, partial [Pseudoxanthomonas sp.]